MITQVSYVPRNRLIMNMQQDPSYAIRSWREEHLRADGWVYIYDKHCSKRWPKFNKTVRRERYPR